MFYYLINKKNITEELRELSHSKNPIVVENMEVHKFDEPQEIDFVFMSEDSPEIMTYLIENNLLTLSD